MPLAQLLVLNRGGLLDVWPTERATADDDGPRLTVEDQDGGAIVDDVTPTLDLVDTTISTAMTARLTFSFTAAAIANIIRGGRYLLGTVGNTEMVRVKNVSGTTVTLYRKVSRSHAAGVPFVGVRLSYTVPAANVVAVFDYGRAFWTWTGQARVLITGVECRENAIQNLVTVDDLYGVDPYVADKIADTEDPGQVIGTAWSIATTECGGAERIAKLWGSDAFKRLVALTAVREWMDKHREDLQRIERASDRVERARAAMLATRPMDANDDGTIGAYEGPMPFGMIDMERG